MNKNKFFINSGKTRINVDNNLKIISSLIPSISDINEHIRSQLGGKEFRPIIIEVSEDKLNEINIEIRRKSSNYTGYSKIAVFIESYSSNKVLPIITIIKK